MDDHYPLHLRRLLIRFAIIQQLVSNVLPFVVEIQKTMVHIGGCCDVMLQLAARWPVAAGFSGQGLVVKQAERGGGGAGGCQRTINKSKITVTTCVSNVLILTPRFMDFLGIVGGST